jgi:hypothetical protein
MIHNTPELIDDIFLLPERRFLLGLNADATAPEFG